MIKRLILLMTVFLFIFMNTGKARDPQKAEWKGKIESENGVKVIKNPREPLYGEIKLDLEEDLSIGKEGDDNYQFYRVRDVEVDNQGNIYVDDMSNYRIQKFDAKGNYLLTFGRKGQGPGEFELPMRVRVDEATGNVYVQDQAFSIEIFDKQGNHLKENRLKDLLFDFSLDDSGNVIAVLQKSSERGTFHTLCKIDAKGEIEAKSPEFPYTWYMEKRGENVLVVTTGYELSLVMTKLDNKTFVYGYSKEYELNVTDQEGKIFYQIRKDEPRPQFSAKEKETFKRKKVPEYKPYYYALFTDPRGRIYVQTNKTWGEEQNIEREVDILSRDGFYLYKTKLPHGTYVIRDGFLFALVVNEEKGGEYVKRYRIKNWSELKEGL
jgi:hypothetical protein